MASFYSVLDSAKREVRLLRPIGLDALENSSGSGSGGGSRGILNYEIAVFSLDSEPRYKALSYCWGEEEAQISITINGEQFLVRPNLHDFLKRYHDVRRRDQLVGVSDQGWIFIDAICINQDDLAERSSQVRLMGDVYRGATEVIAWLGTEGKTEGDVDLEELQSLFDDIQTRLVMFAARRICGQSPKESIIDKNELEPYLWGLTVSLVLRRYWSRLWVVQEILLSESLTIWYKTLDEVSCDVLYECLKHMYSFLKPDHGPSRFGMAWAMTTTTIYRDDVGFDMGLFELLEQKRWFTTQSRDRGMDLSTAINFSARQECSQRHDKVYGLLGMTSGLVPVDYELQIDNIYYTVLIQGLMEIRFQAREPPRPGNIAEKSHANVVPQRKTDMHCFTLTLVHALDMDLHDPVVFQATQYCCALFDHAMDTLSIIWARQHRLNVSLLGSDDLKKFSNRVIWSAATVLHYIAKSKATRYRITASGRSLEKTLDRIFSVLLQARFPGMIFEPDRQRMDVLLDINYVDSSHYKSEQRVARAVHGLKTTFERLRWQGNQGRQDNAGRLKDEQDTQMRFLRDLEQSSRQLPTQTTQGEDSEDATHQRTLIQFLNSPRFMERLSSFFPDGTIEAQFVLYQALHRRLAYDESGSIARFLDRRMLDTDFNDFVTRAANIYENNGALQVREPDDPNYQTSPFDSAETARLRKEKMESLQAEKVEIEERTESLRAKRAEMPKRPELSPADIEEEIGLVEAEIAENGRRTAGIEQALVSLGAKLNEGVQETQAENNDE